VSEETDSRTEQILDLAAQRRQEKQVVDVEVERRLIVIFRLSSRRSAESAPPSMTGGLYGLPAAAVESILPVDGITYVPGAPSWILGVVNVRGEIESVLDLKAVLDLGRAENTPDSRLLIAQDDAEGTGLRSGLLVDRVMDIAYIPASAISPPPIPLEGGKGVYIAGETEYSEQTLVLLNLSEVFHRALETDLV
jgi:purine-binding chemotaxis protein CheW